MEEGLIYIVDNFKSEIQLMRELFSLQSIILKVDTLA